MKQTHIKIVLSQVFGKSHVFINGEEIPAISVDINARGAEPLKARIELLADEVVLEGDYMERLKMPVVDLDEPEKNCKVCGHSIEYGCPGDCICKTGKKRK